MINLPKIELKSDNIEKVKISTKEILEKYRVNHSDILPDPEVILYIGGQMVWTRQNISFSSGKAKGGKTALVKMLVNSILTKGKTDIFESYLPANFDKILWIDTEQARYHIRLGLNQIRQELTDDKMNKLICLTLDTLDADECLQYVKQLIYDIDGIALVILDGIADLIWDSNDGRESQSLLKEMRIWATEKNLHIHNLLHENPTDTNSKMKGHLGTKGADKSECVFSVSSAKDDDELRIVTNTMSRNKKCKPFSFRITSEKIEIQDEEYTVPTAGRKTKKVWKNYERYAILIQAFTGVNKSQGIGYAVLLEKVRENVSEMGENAVKGFVTYAKEMKWICQDVPKGAYFLHDFIE
jgi:hypothetical protein